MSRYRSDNGDRSLWISHGSSSSSFDRSSSTYSSPSTSSADTNTDQIVIVISVVFIFMLVLWACRRFLCQPPREVESVPTPAQQPAFVLDPNVGIDHPGSNWHNHPEQYVHHQQAYYEPEPFRNYSNDAGFEDARHVYSRQEAAAQGGVDCAFKNHREQTVMEPAPPSYDEVMQAQR